MGYYNVGEDPQLLRSGKWLDSTNKGIKHHVVRMGLGTSNNLRYTLATGDLVWGNIQTTGTFNERLVVATEGVVLCVNSIQGTINIGDPVVQDYTNSGGTCGKVMSAVTASMALPSINGTVAGNAADLSPLPSPYPVRPNSLKSTGTATQTGAVLGEASDGTNLAINGPFAGGNFIGLYDYPVIGIALDQANSPNDKFRVRLARQYDLKNSTTV